MPIIEGRISPREQGDIGGPGRVAAMDLAFVVSVPVYDSLPDLPGCVGDGQAISELLKATGRFEEIVVLDSDVTSAKLRDALHKFADDYDDDEIGEMFLYFSGHGLLTEDFIYCTKDFQTSGPRNTSLPNSELDEILRSMGPELAVKIVDSCQSGKRLIKEPVAFESAIRKAVEAKGFKNYIHFASCLDDQSSFATARISDFTREFITGVGAQETNDVLYRYIQNHLVDVFQDNDDQSPFFITQVTGREVFAANSAELGAKMFGLIGRILNKTRLTDLA